MTVLEKTARNQLDKAVQAARRAATAGADRALRALSVDQEKKPAHLSPEQSEIRRRLRVVCRRLGSWDALVRATAYEQWHRMLFARFLAENNLLIHPTYHAPVTLDECAELAREKGVDHWEIAADFASRMLPGIFQKDDPLLLLKFAPEDRMALQEILSGIPAETFRTQDALGWTYQFWQSEEKERVNKSERKIEGADICAVTQLFTEPYMVQFLLQNTLGAWWLHLHPESPLREEWVYYKDQVQHDFSAFPKTAKEIKLLDPACGSGHFLVEAFHMLLAIRQEEGESTEDAIRGIIRDNLHGLEIDPRCIQIAGFAIALEAWKAGYPTDTDLPLPNLACTGLPIRAEKSEWLKLAGGDGLLEGVLSKYYDLFKNADSLGSLIQLEDVTTLVNTDVLLKKLNAALNKEKAIGDPVAEAFGETASGVLKAVSYLKRKNFHIVATNPPFLGFRKQNRVLIDYCERTYSTSKKDIATSFLERSKEFLNNLCIYSMVTPQNWLFLSSDRKLRSKLLKEQKLLSIIRLGEHAFNSEAASGAFAALVIILNTKPIQETKFFGLDLSNPRNPMDKEIQLKNGKLNPFNQLEQMKNPDHRIILNNNEKAPILLEEYCFSAQGIGTTDNPRFVRKFWEIKEIRKDWVFFETSNTTDKLISGCNSVLNWGEEYFGYISQLKGLNRIGGGWQAGRIAWDKKGIAVNVTRTKIVSLYSGKKFDTTIGVIIPKDEKLLSPIFYYLKSPEYTQNLSSIDPSLSVTEGTLIKVPFDLKHWQKVADEIGPLPEPHSEDPTQWLFKGDIIGSEEPLHVAIARLIGYQWPEQPKDDFLDHFADRDGIVCVPPVRGERPAVDRLRDLLAAAYGSEWSPRKEEELLRQDGYTKNGGLEGFLRDEFFASHCKLFHQRPFIWHIWDGTRDGFSVLVNYHRLDRKTLEKLIYSYLGAWITLQKEEVRQEKAGAERRLAAAEELKKNLEKILEGEKPYDIYIRWKPLHEQAIGWEPDLNDGVRMNIRPFVEAGVLRWTPNIKWGKDRGTDPVPNCSGTTERLNDLHFSLEEKRKARENAGKV